MRTTENDFEKIKSDRIKFVQMVAESDPETKLRVRKWAEKQAARIKRELGIDIVLELISPNGVADDETKILPGGTTA